jgi:hypothetical protein
LTNGAAAADILVVHLRLIDSAKRESIDAILEMAELKKSGSATASW